LLRELVELIVLFPGRRPVLLLWFKLLSWYILFVSGCTFLCAFSFLVLFGDRGSSL
jgi:hypothetical protein